MPKEKLPKKLPPWLYTQRALGRFNPAGLTAHASVLTLSPKKIILDAGSLHIQNFFDLKSTISTLLQQGFEVHVYHSDGLNTITSADELDSYKGKASENFNTEVMWKELYEKHDLNRKDCVALGLETNVSKKDIENFIVLFIADFLNKDNLDSTIIPFLESVERYSLPEILNVMTSYMARLLNSSISSTSGGFLYSVIPGNSIALSSAPISLEQLNQLKIAVYIYIRVSIDTTKRTLTFVLSSPEDEFLYLMSEGNLSLKEALLKTTRLDTKVKATLRDTPDEKINEFFFHQLYDSFGEDYTNKLFELTRKIKLDADFFRDISNEVSLATSLQDTTPKPQSDWIYDGESIREMTVFDAIFNRKDLIQPLQALFHCTQRGHNKSIPAWLENESRMAVGKVYHYDGKKLSAETSSLSDLQPLLSTEKNNEGEYELEVFSKNLRNFEIVFPREKKASKGFRYYLIPINHPDLRLIHCNQKDTEIVKDRLGRYILKTRDLKKCKVTLGIPNRPSSNIIDNTNYQFFQEKLTEKGIGDIIQTFFNTNFEPCNKQNIPCSERAQMLLKENPPLQAMCYYVENGTHAFLKIKGTNYSLDLGGARVKKVYRAEKLPKKTVVPKVISPPPHTLFNASEITEAKLWEEYYDTEKATYKKQLIQALNPVQEEKVLLPLEKEIFLSKGIQGVIGNPITTLQAISQWKIPSTAWQYYLDPNDFLKMIQENSTPDAGVTHVINLSPWYIPDQGQRDRLRVKLHEWLITYKDTHQIVLLTDDANSILQDRSMVSRMTGSYRAPNFVVNQEKSEETVAPENNNNTGLQTIDIHAILQIIQADLAKGKTNIIVPLFFSSEDNSAWSLLQNIIQEINITGKMYLDGQYYPEQGRYNDVSIELKQVSLPLKNLFDEICPNQNSKFNENFIYYLNPHLAQYGLLSFLRKHQGESISLVLTQALPEKIWYQLLSEAKKQGCTLCLHTSNRNYWPKDLVFHDDALFEFHHSVIQQSNESILIPIETLQCHDFFYSGQTDDPKNLVQRLIDGEHITLYAHDGLDNEADLQQLLMPLLNGYAIGLNGEYMSISGKLDLIISPKDEVSKQYFPWIPPAEHVDSDAENATAQSESLEKTTHFNPILSEQKKREETLNELYQQVPHIQEDDYVLPDRITEARQTNILNLWKLFGTLAEKINVFSCALIEGPSSIGKTTLAKLLLKKSNHTLVNVLNVHDLQTTNQPIAYVFKGDEDILLTCLQHAKAQGQVLVLDEINTLSLSTQEKIIALLKQENHTPGFCLIGTLNQGYYPGRESFLSELKYYSQPFVFEQYNQDELHDIMRQKLIKLKLNNGEPVEPEFIEDVITSVSPSIEAKDGVLRLFTQSLQALSLPLVSLYWSWFQKRLAETSEPKLAEAKIIVNEETDARPKLIKIDETSKLSQASYMRFYHKGVEEFKKYLKDYIEVNDSPKQYSSHDALLRAFGKPHKTKAHKVEAAKWCLDMLNGKNCSHLYEQHRASLNDGTLGIAFQRIQNQLFKLNEQLVEQKSTDSFQSNRHPHNSKNHKLRLST